MISIQGIFKKNSSLWDGKSLEDALRTAIMSGQGVKELSAIIALLPENRKEHYRKLWKEIVREKNNAKNGQSNHDAF